MGLFSFGKKDDDAPTRRGANTRAGRNTRAERTERVERRTRRTERAGDVDAMMLDPTLPEKQRARRRLVGAIALVIAAVVVLPMVLDSHPKPVTDDISIDIPNRPAHDTQAARDDDTQAGVAPDNPAPEATAAASGVAPIVAGGAPADKAATSGQVTPQASSQAKSPSSAQSSALSSSQSTKQTATAPAAQAQAKKPATQPALAAAAKPPTPAAQAAQQSAANTAAATPSPADADLGTPAAPPGARFAVQLGSFADDASARNWVTKLKAAGVPAYTEHRKQADGSTRILLRAGPFADRAAASAAIAKVREAGLTANAGGGAAGSDQ
ncbi:SPOR domain-containing protein [Trinickia violacea]|uniref:SPOR domain-containing protein n=1 Tax=Trinickia violacea TaxID=2571746 RepID=A0A4P8IZ13_9BURK|nr:SPOR domain-containing protein [Trinickia violacea]QCP54602.1 SPOR domain-containing protein [Trinickia violacea]